MRSYAKKSLAFSLALLWSLPALSLDFKGLARLDYERGKKRFEALQAVILREGGPNYFETLDDFGNPLAVFRGGELDRKRLKRLGFTMEPDVFHSLLKYEPEKTCVKLTTDALGRVIRAEETRKKWIMTYGEWNKTGFPEKMTLQSSKAKLNFQWTDINPL